MDIRYFAIHPPRIEKMKAVGLCRRFRPCGFEIRPRDTGLGPGPAAGGVDLYDSIEMLRDQTQACKDAAEVDPTDATNAFRFEIHAEPDEYPEHQPAGASATQIPRPDWVRR